MSIPIDKTETLKRIKESELPYVKVAVADLDGLLRGKLISKEKAITALKKGFGFCDVIFGWDSTDTLYDKDSVTGWYKGFPDAQVTLDPFTYRQIPWDHQVSFILGDFRNSLPDICPRTLLSKIAKEVEDAGFSTRFAMEFEWFNFKKQAETRQTISEGMFGYSIVRSSEFQDYWSDLFTQLKDFGVMLEGLHTETGPGVMEAAIQATDVMQAADQAILFKTGVKEIAEQHGIVPSFMAKWNAEYPGCSGHLHQSLWTNQNIFNVENNQFSKVAENYLAGLLHCLPFLLPIYAPTVNSYKRLLRDTWAPTTVSWGFDNRTAAVRVITGDHDLSRFELRVPGSDNNPYLTMAAALASGMYGIKHDLKLNRDAIAGNAYEDTQLEQLPKTLQEAIQMMKTSEVPQELFGKAFVDHFILTREWEVSLYNQQVTDWELNRYFEGI